MFANTVAAIFHDRKCIAENQFKIMNNGWIGKGDGVGGGSRGRGKGRGRGRGDLTGVKPFKPVAKELEGVSDEKRSRGEVALFRVIKSKMEEEMEKEDKVKEELLVKNTPPLSKFAHICKTVCKKEERKNLQGFADSPDLHYHSLTLMKNRRCGDF